MKKILQFSAFSVIILILTGCLCSSKKDYPEITCQIVCDNPQVLPFTEEEFAIAFYDITIDEIPKYPSTSASDVYEYVTVIPTDTKAIIDGQEYPISVRKKYEKFMGKKVHKLPSWFVGSPDEDIKGEFYSFTKDSTTLINKHLNTLKNNNVYYNAFFEDAINIMYHPEVDESMRTYNVQQIYVTEYYIKNNQTVTFEAEIVNDTLFLLY